MYKIIKIRFSFLPFPRFGKNVWMFKDDMIVTSYHLLFFCIKVYRGKNHMSISEGVRHQAKIINMNKNK